MSISCCRGWKAPTRFAQNTLFSRWVGPGARFELVHKLETISRWGGVGLIDRRILDLYAINVCPVYYRCFCKAGVPSGGVKVTSSDLKLLFIFLYCYVI